MLAEVIARHFVDARVVEADGVQVVELGRGLPVIECSIDERQDTPPYGVFIFLTIRGGALGEPGALVTASGYGSSAESALVLAGCGWACAFGPSCSLESAARPRSALRIRMLSSSRRT